MDMRGEKWYDDNYFKWIRDRNAKLAGFACLA